MTDQTQIPDSAAADAIATLHDRSVDVLAGFETMVDRAEPEFRPLAERFRDLHRRQSDEIAGILSAAGREPDDDGTFMSTVNRAVVGFRSLVDEIDRDILGQVESGEQNVVEAFDDAIARARPAPVAERLAAMRQDLVALLDEARAQMG